MISNPLRVYEDLENGNCCSDSCGCPEQRCVARAEPYGTSRTRTNYEKLEDWTRSSTPSAVRSNYFSWLLLMTSYDPPLDFPSSFLEWFVVDPCGRRCTVFSEAATEYFSRGAQHPRFASRGETHLWRCSNCILICVSENDQLLWKKVGFFLTFGIVFVFVVRKEKVCMRYSAAKRFVLLQFRSAAMRIPHLGIKTNTFPSFGESAIAKTLLRFP